MLSWFWISASGAPRHLSSRFVVVIFVSAEAPGARVRVCASTFAGQASVASVMRPFINSDFLVLVRIIVSGSQYRF
jgi:hypothetical protein